MDPPACPSNGPVMGYTTEVQVNFLNLLDDSYLQDRECLTVLKNRLSDDPIYTPTVPTVHDGIKGRSWLKISFVSAAESKRAL